MKRLLIALAGSLVTLAFAAAQSSDWTNSGGNAQRNGLSAEVGPNAPTLHWSGGRPSIIAWQPIVAGNLVVQVRQTGFPPGGEPNGSPVVCQDLDTGAEVWATNIPFNTGDWTTWVAGTSNNLFYASRAGNGGSIAAKLYALDAGSGAVVWTSTDTIKTGAYDGVVFAPNGDPILAWHQRIMRIRWIDGTTVWSVPRVGSVSGNCGPAIGNGGLYIADAVPGGHAIKKLSLATGATLYQSPVMTGFTLQNTPFVGTDGTVCLARTQNNVTTDFFYAFADTGAALTTKWSVPCAWTTGSEFGCGPDGSLYLLGPGYVVERRNPANGALMNQSAFAIASGSAAPRFAIGSDGRVFVSNGGFGNGAVYAFEADLTHRFTIPVPSINIGGPCLGQDGTLVVAGTGTDIRAYRNPNPWTDLGHAKLGSLGAPMLTGIGTLEANQPVTLMLTGAGGPTALVIGATQVDLPFVAGILVPAPQVVLSGLFPDGGGNLSLTALWPAGIPPATSLYFQHVISDPGGLFGIAMSNGLKGTTP